MAIILKKAQRKPQPIRLALQGRTGAGKTFSSLQYASVLGDTTCLIDTERSAAANYAPQSGETPDPDKGMFDFFHYSWKAEEKRGDLYDPSRLVAVMKDVGSQVDTLVIDSASHFWEGSGGILDLVNAYQKKNPRNQQQAWGEVANPLLRDIYNAILDAPCNVIFCMRSKLDWGQVQNERTGKSSLQVVGTAPAFKGDILYEVGVAGELDPDTHGMTILKTRFDAVGKVGQVMTANTTLDYIKDLASYLKTNDGIDAGMAAHEHLQNLLNQDGTDDEPVALDKKATKPDKGPAAISDDQFKAIMDLFTDVDDEETRKVIKNAFVKEVGGNPADVLNADNYDASLKTAKELIETHSKVSA